MSQEYIASIVLLIGAVLHFFNINLASDTITTIVAGLLALWVAIRRYQRGDITLAGARKA